jgi:hypothetical protein
MFPEVRVDTSSMSAVSVAEEERSLPELEAFFAKGLRARLLAQEEPVADAAGSRRAEPLSPELVLVCPELRELALRQLPERDPDCFLPHQRVEQASDFVGGPTDGHSLWDEWHLAERLPSGDGDEAATQSPGTPLVLSLLAYTIQQSVHMAVYGVGLFAGTVGLVLLAQFLG